MDDEITAEQMLTASRLVVIKSNFDRMLSVQNYFIPTEEVLRWTSKTNNN
jgi:hypothetical protein